MKKNRFSYGIYALILVLLCSLLNGCLARTENDSKADDLESTLQESQMWNDVGENDAESSQESKVQLQEEEASLEEEKASMVEFVVQPGSYLTEILTDLVNAGWGEDVENVLDHLEQMDRGQFKHWSQIENADERAFAAEGYIAPGRYEWSEGATLEEVLTILLSSWGELITEEIGRQAENQGYSVDEILIMASIVEWESSFAPDHSVKPNVAAVVRNRVESETPLQMDVTIFYLQDSLEPYRDPMEYEEFYDTYIKDGLPAGPIGSPSMESIQAVLEPADTEDLFFVYDEEGNYYFAKDYDQHLINCELAGIY